MFRRVGQTQSAGPSAGGLGGRVIIALVLAVVSLVGYFGTRQVNPVTNETQNISMSIEQEIGLGQEAAQQMIGQAGGESQDQGLQDKVDQIGNALVEQSAARNAPYPFEFHVLADQQTVNAFALPGGQIFVTEGILQILETEGELAGVLAHEIFHVVGRHSAEQMARMQLAEGLTGAAVMATYDPNNPSSAQSAQIAQMVGQVVNMRYGRDDELESDSQGLDYMAAAGYDPRAMVGVMQKLASVNEGPRPPEFFSTHPNPENRIEQIEATIARLFPNGVPDNLKK
jgi:beta-barrel assembly-enhancing protease